MSKLNLQPVTETDRPTSHLTIGETKVGSSNIVAVTHNNRSAFFYVDPEEELVASNIRNKVKFHENVADVFGGIARGQPFQVEADVSGRDVEPCKSATLYTRDIGEERLASFLRSTNYLLHEIEEVALIDGELTHFEVLDLQPRGFPTLMVDEETEFEFVDREERDERRDRGPSQGAGPGPGGQGRGGGQGRDDEDVDIDISPEKPTVSFEEDVAGLDEVKSTAQMLLALFDPETKREVEGRYGEEFAARGGSMLLYGPPGCGKTLVSEAIAYEAANNTNIESEYGDVKFLPVKGGDILSRYPGEAERRVEAVFDRAHSIAQDGFAVLFFDEIETLIPDRSDDDLQRHERSLTNAFLQEMGTDKIEDNLLVIGATNMPFTIDPAASRRFPVQQFIPQPGDEVMSQVWHKELDSLEAANPDVEISYERLGAASAGYTPAEIADRVLGTELQRELVRSVVEDGSEPIVPDTEYLLERLDRNEPKTVRQFITSVREEVDELEGYPEMRRYVEEQADRLGIAVGGGSDVFDQLRDLGGDQAEE
ncbi:ATP-binding protein [Halosimplex rubrum]|uniref:ATP-binding protein n=1 Tax=Halosimplex rubrum TaxID=869889 RepID=A0A7D5SYT4_9EURY|nr:AAA family ATPase [Halosimplex rubrum]QLH76568.1 ATP-binding protein [Halosimplex rubrum]